MCKELVRGVNNFGESSWPAILECGKFPDDMAATALSSKWRQMHHKGLLKVSRGRWYLKSKRKQRSTKQQTLKDPNYIPCTDVTGIAPISTFV